jgi:hypothetical protein
VHHLGRYLHIEKSAIGIVIANQTDLFGIIELLIDKIPVSSLAIASYDPTFDVKNKMLDTIIKLVEVVAKRIN